MSFSETGRLFTFTDYFNAEIDETPFYVYITHSTLPAVHEVAIDSHFNVNFVRSYIVYNEYKGRLIGSDVLSVNQVYVAHLMFDLERMIEIVRIYYRNSSNFAYGHADILLNKFITRVSVVSFLDYSDNPYIFVQNSCLGVLYKINDLKFEIDTVNIKEKYSKYSNKTYRVDMLAYNEEKETEKAFMTFKITFVSQEDMNTYFTGNFDTYYFGYSYGDTSFSKVISDYYMGPDLKFNLTLKSNSSYIRSLILPNITKTQEKSNVREFHTSDECNQSFFNRYGNVETGIENIAFYCIQNSLIEEHIFRTKDLIETKKEIYEYSRYKFIDFYVNLNENSDSIDFTDLLVVLGIQQNYYENLYFLHYFELKNDAITWRRKVFVDTKRIKLRDKNPVIDFNKGEYLVFIDSTEFILMLISSEGEFKHSFKTESKCKDIDIYNDLIFVTYYMSNIVSVYKLSKYSTDKTYYLSTEFLNDFIFNIPLLEFNTKGSRTALTFSRDSTMQLFEIESAYSIVFKREIPLFKYKQNMRFLINRDTNDITYSRLEQFLYVVLYNINNDKDKKLFCFNLKDTNHDMLYSVIDLDPYYYKLDNKIFIENGKFVSTIYIYMFYGGKHYQYIKFEPDNRLQITNSDFKELCVPKNEENMHNYSPINVTMVLYPVYTDYTPTQNRSTNIVLMCMNYGLKIESKSQSNTLLYQNKEVTAKISLLDYFDGFNSNFSVTTENIDQSTYVIEEDKSYDYLLEAVNSTQKVIFIMEYSYYILVFFNQTSKLQVYKVKDGVESIEKIDKEYDYNELFKNCTIDFIDYSYLDWIDESFFILSCKIYSGKINQSFLYKVFHIDKITENSINLTMIFQTYYSYKITMASISAYVNNNTDQYSLVMLAERQTEYDTFIIFENFICNKAFKCKVLGIYKQNGFDYMLDNFIVNSFTFLRNTSYIIASVDNYGLALIDCIPRKLVQLIPIDDKYFQVPPKKMNIYNIIPLDFYGVRVLLQDEGGFSFFWITYHTLGPVILESFTVSERFENINKELPTKLLSEFKGGYAQVIKHPNNEDNFDYFLRIYLSNNHDLSKNYKEFLIDQIDD